jgi:hypothetical protein
MPELPVACTLSPAAFEARRQNLFAKVIARAEQRVDLQNGFRIRFRSDLLPEINRMVEVERQCCRFLRFSVAVEPDEGPVFVDLTGPAGTREFLAAMFDE